MDTADTNRTSIVLTRRVGEAFWVGDSVTVEVSQLRGSRVRLRITAPRDVTVFRDEIQQRRQTDDMG